MSSLLLHFSLLLFLLLVDAVILANMMNGERKPLIPRFSIQEEAKEYVEVDEHKSHKKRKPICLGFVLVLLTICSLVVFAACLQRRREAYRFIVVGGGPAGIIVATKLARAFPSQRVLLLESGTQRPSSVLSERSTDDGYMPLNQFDIPLLWSGLASSAGRRRILHVNSDAEGHHWPIEKTLLGRGLGGSGLLNAMINVRCLPSDVEAWNVTGWNYETLLEHYKELESYHDTHIPVAPFWNRSHKRSDWRGYDGPLTTVPAGVGADALAPRFVQAAMHAGEPLASEGFNAPDGRVGVGYYEFNIRHGVRDSVAHAFLKDIPDNLHIQLGATVARVLTKQKRAIGVELHRDGRVEQVHVTQNGEVILSAGAVLSPQLLVNSGIGPAGEVADLKGVGKNLQDHPVVALSFGLDSKVLESSSSIYTVGDELEDYFLSVEGLNGGTCARMDETLDENVIQAELVNSLGAFGSPGFSAGAFLLSPWAKDGIPDIQLTVFPREIEPHVLRKENYVDELEKRTRSMLVTVALLQPEARYEVKTSHDSAHVAESLDSPETRSTHILRDFSPRVDHMSPLAKLLSYKLPLIEIPNGQYDYLSDHDVERLEWGIERVRVILQHSPLADVTTGEIQPGPQIHEELLQLHIREHNLPNSHWVGSSKMGNDELSVVDERLRVHGVDGLRVVDGGVIPRIPNGNTHSTVCVVASYAAGMIVADHSSS